MAKYTVGMRVKITQDCRPWWKRVFGRDLTGREGKLVEYAIIEDSPELTDLQIPVFQVGRHQIAGFECWWDSILRKSTARYVNALLDALEKEINKPEQLDWCIAVRNAIYHVCMRGSNTLRLTLLI